MEVESNFKKRLEKALKKQKGSKKQKASRKASRKRKSSETDSDNISLHDSSEEEPAPLKMKLNDFVLIKFVRKQTPKFFVGIINEINLRDKEILVNFLKKKSDCMKFVYPDKEEGSWVDFSDVEIVLTPVDNDRVTLRGASLIHFYDNISKYNIE